MNPLFIALGIFAGFQSASASYQAGQEERRLKYEEAQNAEIEKRQSEIQAQQQQNNRLRDFAEAKAINEAFFAYAGRGASDQSAKAFFDYNEDIAYEDITRIANTSLIRSLQYDTHASNLRRAGDYAERAGSITAFSTIINTGLNTARTA